MKTVKQYLSSILTSLVTMIVVAAGIALVFWFLGQVVFKLPMGGFLVVWKWSYIVLAGLLVLYDLFYGVRTLLALWTYSKIRKVPFCDVETAWWDLRFRKHHREMLTWNAEEFRKQFEQAKALHIFAKEIAEAIMQL